MEEKEKGDPKEDMKKEKTLTTDSPFFGNMIAAPFNDAEAKGHIRVSPHSIAIPPLFIKEEDGQIFL